MAASLVRFLMEPTYLLCMTVIEVMRAIIASAAMTPRILDAATRFADEVVNPDSLFDVGCVLELEQ